MQHDLESSASDWVIDYPQTLAAFERYGVDYTCGGKSLAYACRQRGLDPAWFLNELRKVVSGGDPSAV